jgi:predicted DNA binding CopG/RHH family protein
MATKRKSGPTQPEHERLRRMVGLRLPLDQLARVDELAAARGIARARVLAELIDQALDLAAPTPDHSRRTTTAA